MACSGRMNIIVVVFILVYLGMALGTMPFLKTDRTGFAMLGAIVLVATGMLNDQAVRTLAGYAVDLGNELWML